MTYKTNVNPKVYKMANLFHGRTLFLQKLTF